MSHSDPDGDAVGSEYALAQILTRMGKTVLVLNSDDASDKFTFFDDDNIIGSLEGGRDPPSDLENWTSIILDTGDLDHLGTVKNLILPHTADYFIIDHHTPSPSTSKERAYVVESAAATCEIVFDLAQILDAKITLQSAYALFSGIVYDTGSFIYSKTSSHTMDVARQLMEIGVLPQKVHSNLYEQIEPSRMRLMAKVQSSLELLENDQISLQILTLEMLESTGAKFEDAENFINYPLKCNTIKISLFIKQLGINDYKISLRSKGSINISILAISMGGGGHRNAAGFALKKPLEQVRNIVLESCRSLIR